MLFLLNLLKIKRIITKNMWCNVLKQTDKKMQWEIKIQREREIKREREREREGGQKNQTDKKDRKKKKNKNGEAKYSKNRKKNMQTQLIHDNVKVEKQETECSQKGELDNEHLSYIEHLICELLCYPGHVRITPWSNPCVDDTFTILTIKRYLQ